MIHIQHINQFEKLANSNNIYNFCQSFLAAVDLKAVEFYRIFPNESRINLTTSPKWFEFFYQNKLYNFANLQYYRDCLSSGWYLWQDWDKNSISYQKCGRIAAEKFDFVHGISFVRKNKDYCDVFQLVAGSENYAANEFYLSNFDLLERYFNYFISDPAGLIAKALSLPLILPSNKKNNWQPQHHDLIKGLVTDTIISRTGYKQLLKGLTLREKQCLFWLSYGHSTPEIAKKIELSPRTIEKYIANIKTKFNCQSLFQLGSITHKLQHTLALEFYLNRCKIKP